MKKPRCTADDDSSTLSGLPDEIIFEILNKIIDLKTLCFCKLVSKHLSSNVHHVDAISFTVPSDSDKKTCKSFCSAAFMSMNKFRCVKSFYIDLPIFTQKQEEGFLSKWKFKFGNKGESFMFLSPNSVYESNTKKLLVNSQKVVVVEEQEADISKKKISIALDCYVDAFERFLMLFKHISSFSLLEKVSIKDSDKRGRISFNGRGKTKIGEVRVEIPRRYSRCYLPLLELPVSGYVMKGVTLVLVDNIGLLDGDESFMNDDDFEDKEEVVYGEAIMEIFKKHRGRIRRLLLP